MLNMFLHSSELAPSATPRYNKEGKVVELVKRIRNFLAWLTATGPVQGVTLSKLYPASIDYRCDGENRSQDARGNDPLFSETFDPGNELQRE